MAGTTSHTLLWSTWGLGSEGWGVRALAGAAPEATGHSPSLPGLMSPDTGVPESLPAYTPVSKKEHHAAVACSGGRAFSHRKEGKEGRQEEEGEPEGPWLTLFLCPPPLTAASQTKCAQQKVFEAQ